MFLLCVSLISCVSYSQTTHPKIVSVYPEAVPCVGSHKVSITTEDTIDTSTQLSCYFNENEMPFISSDDTHGTCYSPDFSGMLEPPVFVEYLLIDSKGKPPKQNITKKMTFYNVTLRSGVQSTFKKNQVLFLQGEGFIEDKNSQCILKQHNTTFMVKGLFSTPTVFICYIEDILGKLVGQTMNITLNLNGQDESLSVLEYQFTEFSESTHILAFIVISLSILFVVVLLTLLAVFILKNILKKKTDVLQDLINPGEVLCEEVIGSGSFGDVWRAKWRGENIAVKLIPTRSMVKSDVLECVKEIQLMRRLTHPNVLQFFGCGTDENYILIAMALMERGSVHQMLSDKSFYLSWPRRLQMLHDVAMGMNYLHTQTPPIIHRDLKSHNLLVDQNWSVKVSDFGLSVTTGEMIKTTICGTLAWIAPEILSGQPYNTKVDVYSFGIVMWEFLTRDVPYKNVPPQSLPNYVTQVGLRPKLAGEVDNDYLELMTLCWKKQPVFRPDFAEVCQLLSALIAKKVDITPLN
ncbi:serine/threonine protein kinase-transforming protein Rmil, putative [Entamoeba invadens IP1]|uniref:Serine/threonine protein kinase-transforming protein Rmil, putative n=1 Tax=Entamoeba invadens IP1 TaxID=370355 RepID=A0A0A1U153_ENTIV|nr:serine/threonine protein kinase-transforming protein Rmil, putative [Entamoeba invadens IP1]ELP87777.1 serine/threonine protein kinase-transforming protein Rmil, putative [Entamoeba invadens IP1]|eukprot:XP_004254548.1 serine/threonine protein kinase-transforming protein Rmil, putative [Entamoeba invadens IP1]